METKRKRTIISLQPEIYDIFVRMAAVNGTSVSRCMGDWLETTAEGAQFVSAKMQEIRNAPVSAMREFHAYAKGLPGEVSDLFEEFATGRTDASPAVAKRAGRGIRAAIAPSSNTGLNTPRKTVSPRK